MNARNWISSAHSALCTLSKSILKHKLSLLTLAVALAALLLPAHGVTAQLEPPASREPAPIQYAGTGAGAGFTYQGHLKKDGAPVNGQCGVQFSLWDAQNGGNRIGQPWTVSVTVKNGLFTQRVNDPWPMFGPTAFDGTARWLEVAVKCPNVAGDYTTLSRQQLDPVPYARALALPYERTADGPVKAAVVAYCDSAGSSISHSFNNVSTTAITITPGAAVGECSIDFGFQVSDRYVIATARSGSPRMVNFGAGADNEKLYFTVHDAAGDGTASNIVVVVY